MNESDLMEYVRADFEKLGYTTYAEVCHKGGGSKRCDMYARIEDKTNPNYGHTIVFEAKLSFSFKVLEQADFWKNKAHDTYIVVPSSHKQVNSRRFARRLASGLGLGVIEVNIKQGKYFIYVKPVRCVNPKYPTLYVEQKLTKASNSTNTFVTPFKITVKNLETYMLNKDQEYLTELVKNIQHHYKSPISAVRSIRFLIDKNVIKDFYIIKEKNKLVIKKYGF